MGLYEAGGKRALDVVVALAGLPLLGLAVIVLTPLFKLGDRGPVFYRSQRRGVGGQHFTMYKFRSMAVDAPDLRHADLSTVNADDDGRVTRLGRVLRRTSIDELPQLINVLRGDMSFVGPRPNLTTQSWDELTAEERKRIQVRPGITGLSQALYRNSASTRQKYMIDCLYVDRVSLAMDARIVARTLLSVAQAKNINGGMQQQRRTRE